MSYVLPVSLTKPLKARLMFERAEKILRENGASYLILHA